MTMRECFLDMMRQRRRFPRGSGEWDWRTKAARKYLWMHLGVPTTKWVE
ncbi:hypothetical protein KUV62_15880 [Salipiger bermudensis]|nr:hypothetical protein [Salipiger bermudensis]MBY6005405.1 hypothetical protein [Salipiger bermudensis]